MHENNILFFTVLFLNVHVLYILHILYLYGGRGIIGRVVNHKNSKWHAMPKRLPTPAVEYGVSNTKVVVSIPRESKNW